MVCFADFVIHVMDEWMSATPTKGLGWYPPSLLSWAVNLYLYELYYLLTVYISCMYMLLIEYIQVIQYCGDYNAYFPLSVYRSCNFVEIMG